MVLVLLRHIPRCDLGFRVVVVLFAVFGRVLFPQRGRFLIPCLVTRRKNYRTVPPPPTSSRPASPTSTAWSACCKSRPCHPEHDALSSSPKFVFFFPREFFCRPKMQRRNAKKPGRQNDVPRQWLCSFPNDDSARKKCGNGAVAIY